MQLLKINDVELGGIILSEKNQSKEDKYHMISHMWNLKQNKTKQAHRNREQIG